MSPITIVTFCITIAAITLLSYCYYKQINLFHKKSDIVKFIIMGAFSNWLPLIFACYSLQYVTTIIVGIVLATTPICTAILAHIFINEKLTFNKIIGIILGFIGIIILLEPNIDNHINYAKIMLATMSAISCSIAIIYTKKNAPQRSNTVTATLQITYSAIILLPLMFIVDGTPCFTDIMLKSWSAIIIFAILGTALAFIIYFKILQDNNAVFLASVNYLLPIFKTIIGVIFLNEIITSNIIVASILVFLAMAAIYCKVPILKFEPFIKDYKWLKY